MSRNWWDCLFLGTLYTIMFGHGQQLAQIHHTSYAFYTVIFSCCRFFIYCSHFVLIVVRLIKFICNQMVIYIRLWPKKRENCIPKQINANMNQNTKKKPDKNIKVFYTSVFDVWWSIEKKEINKKHRLSISIYIMDIYYVLCLKMNYIVWRSRSCWLR